MEEDSTFLFSHRLGAFAVTALDLLQKLKEKENPLKAQS